MFETCSGSSKPHSILEHGNADTEFAIVRLISCAARRDDPSSASADELALQLGLTKCLIHSPNFLSLTYVSLELFELFLRINQAKANGYIPSPLLLPSLLSLTSLSSTD